MDNDFTPSPRVIRPFEWGMTLEDYVTHLLGIGKKIEDAEFQSLILCFKNGKIELMAKQILERLKTEVK